VTHIAGFAEISIVLVAASLPALAVEGAVGRTLPGAWVMPQGGVIGPHSGFNVTLMPIGYSASTSGRQEIPDAGLLEAEVSANVSLNYVVPQYIYNTKSPTISLATTFMAPVAWVGVTTAATLNDLARTVRHANAGMSDLIMSPLSVGIHFSRTNNLAINPMIFAPTGPFVLDNPSNKGQGTWTFMPSLAHTYAWPTQGLELDNFLAFDIYRHNPVTGYKNGTVFHWDGMLLKYVFKERFGFGGILSNLTQLNRDEGQLADVLHGFQGRAWGSGPIFLYIAKHEKPEVAIQFRWVREFDVTKLLKGEVLLLGLTVNVQRQELGRPDDNYFSLSLRFKDSDFLSLTTITTIHSSTTFTGPQGSRRR
jgi:hypothetical protein